MHEELALEAVDPVYPAWDIRISILARQARRVSDGARTFVRLWPLKGALIAPPPFCGELAVSQLAALNQHDDALQDLLGAVDAREKRIDMGRREVRVWRELVVETEMDRARRR